MSLSRPLPPPPTPAPQMVATMVPGTPVMSVSVPVAAALPIAIPCRSAHAQNLTEAGKAFAAEHAAAKAHLDELQDRHARMITQEVSAHPDDLMGSPSLPEGVDGAEHLHANSLGTIKSNDDIPDLTADVVIGEQAHIVEEQAHIAIRSNKRRDPSSPDYDMSIPLATYEEAIQRPDHEQWLVVMKTELQTMKDMSVYKVAELPEGRKAIGCHWVLKFKEDNKGSSVYKARLVTQGFSQVPGIDYGPTFAPVIKPVIICLLTALGCQNDWEINTFDAKRAFLWGVLKEEIYMRQSKGFEQGDWRKSIWLMLRSIYGLKQLVLEWYEQVCFVMSDLGFIHTESDHILFYYDGEDDITMGITNPTANTSSTRVRCLIGWHIDDGMGVSNSCPFLKKVKWRIVERFGIKDLGPVTKYLGVQFE